MAVRILIKRYVKEGANKEVVAILNGLRSAALYQHGYISGETLVNHYNDRIILVISTWSTVADWVNWQENDDRVHKEARLNDLLVEPPIYEIYDCGAQ